MKQLLYIKGLLYFNGQYDIKIYIKIRPQKKIKNLVYSSYHLFKEKYRQSNILSGLHRITKIFAS